MMKFEELAEAWLEDYQKSVKHKTYINTNLDIRFIYNKALYLRQRKEMMQWYADEVDKFVDFGKYKALEPFIKNPTV